MSFIDSEHGREITGSSSFCSTGFPLTNVKPFLNHMHMFENEDEMNPDNL